MNLYRLFCTVDGTFGTNVGPATKTIVTYLFLGMFFAIVGHFFGWNCRDMGRLSFSLGCGSDGVAVFGLSSHSGRHFND